MVPAVKISVPDGDDVWTRYVLGRLPEATDAVVTEIRALLAVDCAKRVFTVEDIWLAEARP